MVKLCKLQNRGVIGGLQGYCRGCTRELAAIIRVRDKDVLRVKAFFRRKQLRVDALVAYGGQCACCGEKAYEFLAIDHINGGGLAERRRLGGGGEYIYRA